eukprot:gene13228-27990_t
MQEYEDEDDGFRRNRPRQNASGDAQPAVRKHLTVFNTIFKTYEKKLYTRNIHDQLLLQPHYHYMRNIATPHSNLHHPADGICSHFLLHGFNRLQKSAVNVGCWSAEARRLVLGTQTGEFTLWEGETFKFERLISTHTPHAVKSMTWSNNGAILISGDQSGVIKYFNSSITFVNSISNAHTNAVRGLSFSPSDAKFVSCSDVRCAAWHPHRSLVCTGSKDNTVKLWDPRSDSLVTTLFGHKNTVLSCGWNVNGNLLATGARDQLVK